MRGPTSGKDSLKNLRSLTATMPASLSFSTGKTLAAAPSRSEVPAITGGYSGRWRHLLPPAPCPDTFSLVFCS